MEILGYLFVLGALALGARLAFDKIRGSYWPRLENAVVAAVVARNQITQLPVGMVVAQLDNFMTRGDKNAVELALKKISDRDVLHLFLWDNIAAKKWPEIYDESGLTREERAVVDEFVEDVSQIVGKEPF